MIFHIPHASTAIPADIRGKFVLSEAELAAEVLAMTDHFTDELFGASAEPGDAIVITDVSRLVVDVERFPDDTMEPMSSKGMGVVYTHTSRLTPLRRPVTPSERACLLDRYYFPHHLKLEQCVAAELEAAGSAFVMDCHSFPSRALPYENDPAADRPDFCLGTDDYHTPEDLVALVRDYLLQRGFSVRINTPFSGALVPQPYFRRDSSVIALMIEVNRGLYMDELTGEKQPSRFENIQRDIAELVLLCKTFLESEGDTTQIVRLVGEVMASQDWDSGGPGAGAGTVELYSFLGRFYTFHDAGYSEYDSLDEAISRSDVFRVTDATQSIWIDPSIKQRVDELRNAAL